MSKDRVEIRRGMQQDSGFVAMQREWLVDWMGIMPAVGMGRGTKGDRRRRVTVVGKTHFTSQPLRNLGRSLTGRGLFRFSSDG